ncbi:peptidylprolyl isomerase [Candidatus Saganbacteria bacterium]|nr:peptidylprolyl isomerase [Candidatus Saganbacteria bacterium]
MLTFLRKKTKIIMIIVAVVFVGSMFYGLGYAGIKQISSGKNAGFIKINGKEVDPMRFNDIFSRIRQNFPEALKPSDLLFVQNLALSQTIDFSIILDEARKRQRISNDELNATLDQIAKQQKFNSIGELKNAMERSNVSFSKFRKMIRDEIAVQKMVQEIRNQAPFSPNDLKEIKASHILITIKPNIQNSEEKSRKLAEEIKARAEKGENFAALAKKYSEDPGSKDRGGDLGFFSTGSMVKPFEDLAYSLKIGDVGGPVKTDFGYHIIKVSDARVRVIKGKSDVEAAVRQEKQERAFQDWFYKLKQKAKVEILDSNMRALDLRFKGKVSEAIAEYKRSIAQNPQNAYPHLFLGLLLEDSGDIKSAISEYKNAASIAAADPNMYIVLGQALVKNNEKNLAAEQFRKASLIAGDNKNLHKELQKTYKSMGMGGLAAKEMEEIIRIEKKEAFERGLQEKSSKIKTE